MSVSADKGTMGALKLPACERCRLRKVKCDGRPPKCSACGRGGTACIIVDPVTNERYTRDGLDQLERKLRTLEAASANAKDPSTTPSVKSPSGSGQHRGSKTHFVGDGSGLNYFKQLSKSAATALPNTGELATAVFRSPNENSAIPAHGLPALPVAQTLAEHFSSHVHLHHPLLPYYEVSNLLERVYSPEAEPPVPEDMFRIFMVFAVSSVTTYRRGQTPEHPYGYFRAAQPYLSKVQLIGSLGGVQNSLLIARFAMYYHINCSIWDIARLAMRQCIALGLHRPPTRSLAPMDEQLQRNIFWDCYVHDRYSSGILGRPFAVAEEDITVKLPVEVSDEDLLFAQATSLNDPSLQYSTKPNSASVFRFVVTLRRLTTRISNCFFSSRPQTQTSRRSIADAGRVKMEFNSFMDALAQSRSQAPVFQEPKSLYERPEWYDFLVEKDRLTLIRGAIAQMPVDGLHPPRGLLQMCLDCAVAVIELYTKLFSRGQITWTRSYFQILFTSGLSIMYAMSILKHERPLDQGQLNGFARASQALSSASDTMKIFVGEMPDAGRFAVVFEALMKQHAGTGTRTRPSRAPTPPVQDGGQQQPSSGVGYLQHESSVLPLLPHNAEPAGQLSIPFTDTRPAQPRPDYSFGLELGIDDFQDWSVFPFNPDNVIGQVEASLGEYAWGMPQDDSVFDQWDVFRGPA